MWTICSASSLNGSASRTLNGLSVIWRQATHIMARLRVFVNGSQRLVALQMALSLRSQRHQFASQYTNACLRQCQPLCQLLCLLLSRWFRSLTLRLLVLEQL